MSKPAANDPEGRRTKEKDANVAHLFSEQKLSMVVISDIMGRGYSVSSVRAALVDAGLVEPPRLGAGRPQRHIVRKIHENGSIVVGRPLEPRQGWQRDAIAMKSRRFSDSQIAAVLHVPYRDVAAVTSGVRGQTEGVASDQHSQHS